MNFEELEKEMIGKIIKGNLNGKKIAEQWINVNNAILIAKQYAEKMCKQQREICASEYHKNTNAICLDSKTFNKILHAVLDEKETRI